MFNSDYNCTIHCFPLRRHDKYSLHTSFCVGCRWRGRGLWWSETLQHSDNTTIITVTQQLHCHYCSLIAWQVLIMITDTLWQNPHISMTLLLQPECCLRTHINFLCNFFTACQLCWSICLFICLSDCVIISTTIDLWSYAAHQTAIQRM